MEERLDLAGGAGWWEIWQIVDSLLPTGGFAHSSGLEAALQLGFIENHGVKRAELRPSNQPKQSIESMLRQVLVGVASLQGPSTARVAAATVWAESPPDKAAAGAEKHSAARSALDQWVAADRQLHATLATSHVNCKASIAQGQALLRVAREMFASECGSGIALFQRLQRQWAGRARQARRHRHQQAGNASGNLGSKRRRVAECEGTDSAEPGDHAVESIAGPFGHLAPALGYVIGRLWAQRSNDNGMHSTARQEAESDAATAAAAAELAVRVLVFTTTRDAVSATCRLGIVSGALHSMRLLRALGPLAERWAKTVSEDVMNSFSTPGTAQEACGVKLSFTRDETSTIKDVVWASPMQTSPVLEILQGAHDVMYSRVFIS
uniref:Urease accessory protein UreF n=1 Tax=Fibrocapsa japonica TaxID=94617 RepID=A0A6U1PZU5_9STRA|mmetsp:Transcript_6022/g.9111  ORF Transcript_6022/g.9111 Transcript_6022/m.9111 type:complete len:380 (+) Transcript_6022:2-1141(+)